MTDKERQIFVVGGGVAGLSAARQLALAGVTVTILEARERLGGRIYTEQTKNGNGPIELGAEFLHGKHPELWQMAHAAGMLVYETGGEHRHLKNGRLVRNAGVWDKVDQILSKMTQSGPSDLTFADFLNNEFVGPEWDEARKWAIAYVEGFNSADHKRVSVQWLIQEERASDSVGTRQFRSANGYSPLVHWLENSCVSLGVKILRSAVVRRVVWQEGRVSSEVEVAGSTIALSGHGAIITVPLGVLQAGAICFEPDVERNLSAARRLAFGPVVRITLQCTDAFWERRSLASENEELSKLSFLHAENEPVPTWWTQYPLQSSVITGWVGGPKAAALAALPEAERIEAALSSLSHIAGMNREHLGKHVESVYHHDWQRDPFSRGAYCYVPVGALDAIKDLASPCQNTLFFAGEATDIGGHTGTVHGAIASGLRAAKQAMQ